MSRRFVPPRSPRGERGASALEMAFLAPGFLLLIFLTIQGALYFYGSNVAIQAAREGVSQARLQQDLSDFEAQQADIEKNTETYANTLGRGGLNDADAKAGYQDARGTVSMRVSGTTITLLPGLHLKVSEIAHGHIERFEGDEVVTP